MYRVKLFIHSFNHSSKLNHLNVLMMSSFRRASSLRICVTHGSRVLQLGRHLQITIVKPKQRKLKNDAMATKLATVFTIACPILN